MMKDRGLIKWSVFMTPEHNRLLEDWYSEDGYEERIELSEEQIEEIEQTVHEALMSQIAILIEYYQPATHVYGQVCCKVLSCDGIDQTLRVINQTTGNKETINLHDIHKVEFVERMWDW